MKSQRSHGLVEETRRICAASYPYCSPLFRYGHQTAEKGLKKAYGKFFKGVRASKDMFERWQIKTLYLLLWKSHMASMDSIRIITFCICALFLGKQSLPGIKAGYVQSLERLLFKSRSGQTSEKHGLDLQAGNEAGAYVAKMGLRA